MELPKTKIRSLYITWGSHYDIGLYTPCSIYQKRGFTFQREARVKGDTLEALELQTRGFPKIGWIPEIRTIVFWGLCWGHHILGNYYVGCRACRFYGVKFTFEPQSKLLASPLISPTIILLITTSKEFRLWLILGFRA